MFPADECYEVGRRLPILKDEIDKNHDREYTGDHRIKKGPAVARGAFLVSAAADQAKGS